MRPVAFLGLLLCAAPLHAQSLREQCVGQPNGTYCQRIADAAASVPARVAILSAGGNALAGTTGTLGMRLPGSPRVSAALRGTLGRARMPDIALSDATGEIAITAGSLALDAGVGLFDGVNLAPTIGGFASIDLLASAGLLRVPEDDGLRTSSSFTWAAGARVGILRESFTAPGVSVSAMYRSIPDVSYVAGTPPNGTALFDARDQSVTTVRGTVGKRVLGIGFTGGVGYDRTKSDVTLRYGIVSTGDPILIELDDELTDSRVSYFGNASYTTAIVNFVLELGWQHDGDRAAGAHRSTRRGGVFGGAAIRLTI